MNTHYLKQLYVVLAMLGLIDEYEAAVGIVSLASMSSARPLPWFLDNDAVRHAHSVMLEADQLWLDGWISQQLEDIYVLAAREVEAVKTDLSDGRVHLYIRTCRQTVCLWLEQMPAADELVARLSA